MDTHTCMKSVGYLIPPDKFIPWWRMPTADDTNVKVSFCPFCGERLPKPGERPVRRGAAIDLIEPIPERFTD